jgi:TBC1 domain family member 7
MERTKYYSSLGFKSIDVKPTIENAFQDQILLQDRLDKLCLWVRIPHRYRALVWKVSLGILPYEKQAWTFFSNVRREQFDALKTALGTILGDKNILDQELIPEQMVDMMMIELNIGSPLDIQRSFRRPRPAHLVSIAKAFLNICDDAEEEDSFWLYCMYIRKCKVPLKNYIPDIKEVQVLLEQLVPDLYHHMKSLGVNLDFISPWYCCHFSSILSVQVLEGVWDIIVGGAIGILPFIAVALLMSCSKKLLLCKTATEILSIINTVFDSLQD